MSSDSVGSLVTFLLLGGVAYFLLIRPVRKRARDAQTLQTALSAGDEVMLTSGFFGRVTAMGPEDRIDVELSPGVVVTVHRGAIGKIIRDVPADAPAVESEYDKDAAPYERDDTDEQPRDVTDEDPNPRGAN